MSAPLRRTADPPTGRRAPTGVWAPERRALSIGLLLAVTLVAFESLSVATIMPIVGHELDGLELYGWVFSAFFLGDLVGIVASGAQADRGGLARPFALGLGLFAIGLVIDGLAPSMAVLVVGRSIQGFGAGAVPTVAYVAIGRRYPDRIRPLMFASMSSAWVVPGLAGPAIAGLVADHLTWRYVFLGLIPLVAIALLITTPALRHPETDPVLDPALRASAGTELRRRLVPALRVALGAALILGALTARDLLSLLLGLGGIALGLPALRQLVPAGTLTAARGLPAVILLRGVVTFGFFGAEAFLPLTLVSVRGASATEAGLALTVATLTWTAGSWIQARLMAPWGAVRLIRWGLVGVTVGVAGVATVLASAVPVEIGVLSWGLAGGGMGLAYSPISLTVIRDAPSGQEGSATAAMQLCDVLGTALGTGLGGAIVAAGVALAVEAHLYLAVAFAISVAVSAVGVGLTMRIRRPAVVPA
ncbi:MAG TPA: MFS transporter [Candidatus Limnocylindrales bacterium]|nr:MFS transporter [Candidatus Limnocylindrales bacterium]